jgi:hypothetical protein
MILLRKALLAYRESLSIGDSAAGLATFAKRKEFVPDNLQIFVACYLRTQLPFIDNSSMTPQIITYCHIKKWISTSTSMDCKNLRTRAFVSSAKAGVTFTY